ncbi:MAG: type II secretion system protein GspM [Nitrospiraceae bacterium]
MDALRQRWGQLSTRERWLVGAGMGVLALGLLFALVLDPLLDEAAALDRQHNKKRRHYEELVGIAEQHRELRERLASIEQRLAQSSGSFSLLAFLEETAVTTGIRDLIVGMQPQPAVEVAGYQENAVEMRLDGLQLPQLLALVGAIDGAPALVEVKRLQVVPRYDSPHLLQVTIRISSYEKVG